MGPEGYAWEYDDTPGNRWNRRWTLCWSGRYPPLDALLERFVSEGGV
jgi:hypothetical protein